MITNKAKTEQTIKKETAKNKDRANNQAAVVKTEADKERDNNKQQQSTGSSQFPCIFSSIAKQRL